MTLPPKHLLIERLRYLLREEESAGKNVTALVADLERAGGSYDALDDIARRIDDAPFRSDWSYDEPDDLDDIVAAADPNRATDRVARIEATEARGRIEAAFLASVCGCMLGKPFEINPTLAELRAALEPAGEWPLDAYPSETVVLGLREVQGQWRELVRDRIDHVAADDDINYTVLGMLALERHGVEFTRDDLLRLWLYNVPLLATFGPERTLVARAAAAALEPGSPPDLGAWAAFWNPGTELCGALIRADAYGYACLGHPELAAALAWRDAGMTHRRTGLYGAMFVAAAIAAAPTADDPLQIFETALQYIPQRSRLAEAVRFGLDAVAAATGWEAAYDAIHDRFGDFGHCLVLQEVGTLINTLRFATDVGHGICLQVMQGNDTDSFGATAGSILGAYFGPGHLEPRWTEAFADHIQLALATTWISSLSELTERMGSLSMLADGGAARPRSPAPSRY